MLECNSSVIRSSHTQAFICPVTQTVLTPLHKSTFSVQRTCIFQLCAIQLYPQKTSFKNTFLQLSLSQILNWRNCLVSASTRVRLMHQLKILICDEQLKAAVTYYGKFLLVGSPSPSLLYSFVPLCQHYISKQQHFSARSKNS